MIVRRDTLVSGSGVFTWTTLVHLNINWLATIVIDYVPGQALTTGLGDRVPTALLNPLN